MIDREVRRRRLWEHNMMTTQVMLRAGSKKKMEGRKVICEESIFDRI